MQPITLRHFPQPDRDALEKRIVRLVEENSEYFLRQYENDPRSFGGRYICADLFKEILPEYAESKDTRARYNAVVHNAAAVLAAEQFNQVISDRARTGHEVIFLTGIPGAGKSSSISVDGKLPLECRAVFEGQLARPATSIPKIQAVLDAGLQPVIIVVHNTPEQALANTFKRFEETGRGAGIKLMADIQGDLPAGLAAIRERFFKDVKLLIHDYTDRKAPAKYSGWEHVAILQREGNHERIHERLVRALERHRTAGAISDDCWEQAHGRVPRNLAFDASLERQSIGRNQADERGRGVPESDRQQVALDRTLSRAQEVEHEGKALLDNAREAYSATLDVYYQAKVSQAERLETKIDKAIAVQQARLNAGQAKKPGFFRCYAKPAWKKRQDQAVKRLAQLFERKNAVHKIKTAMGGERLRRLATEKLRFRESDLAREHDAALAREKQREEQARTLSLAQEREQKQHDLKSKKSLGRQRRIF